MIPTLPSSAPRVFRILLVEDNPGDADLVRAALASASDRVEITHVESLSAARTRLVAGGVDVVLLDLSLPDATGVYGVEHLHGVAPPIPIVVLTGSHDEALGASVVQAGAQDYLVKGQTDEWLLIRAMRYAIERHQLRAERARLLAQAIAARLVAGARRDRASFLAEVSLLLTGSLDDAGLDERLAPGGQPRGARARRLLRDHAVQRFGAPARGRRARRAGGRKSWCARSISRPRRAWVSRKAPLRPEPRRRPELRRRADRARARSAARRAGPVSRGHLGDDRAPRLARRDGGGDYLPPHGRLGLGLYIARTLVMTHGGSIAVTSELGQGATFPVRLPLEPPSIPERSKAAS